MISRTIDAVHALRRGPALADEDGALQEHIDIDLGDVVPLADVVGYLAQQVRE